MTDIVYDTEFIENGQTIRLLSIGIVWEGKEYYAVCANATTITNAVYNFWLRKNVVPSLPIRLKDPETGAPWEWDREHRDFRHVKPAGEIAVDVERIVLSVPRPRLWAYYGAYDHVVLCQLFGRMIDLPRGFPMHTNDIKQLADDLGNPELPRLRARVVDPAKPHNALWDAREAAFRLGWLRDYRRLPAGLDALLDLESEWSPAGRVSIAHGIPQKQGVHEFDPDWTMAPAAILRDWMGVHDRTLEQLVSALPLAQEGQREIAVLLIQDVLDRKPLSGQHADLLERGTGVSAATWLSAERIYRKGLAAGKKDVT